jgi:hypothetical protein
MNTEKIEYLFPPNPPTCEEECKFEYVSNKNDREMLSTAYQALTLLEAWDYIRSTDHFMFNNNDILNKISNKIEELGYDGHSGSSFAYTLQSMKFISLNGEEKFKNDYFDYERKAKNNIDIQNRRNLLKTLQEE